MKYPVINMTETGRRIKGLRLTHGMSVKQLSTIMGLESTQSVYAWEQGRSIPTLDHLLIMSALLDITVEDIVALDWINEEQDK